MINKTLRTTLIFFKFWLFKFTKFLNYKSKAAKYNKNTTYKEKNLN